MPAGDRSSSIARATACCSLINVCADLAVRSNSRSAASIHKYAHSWAVSNGTSFRSTDASRTSVLRSALIIRSSKSCQSHAQSKGEARKGHAVVCERISHSMRTVCELSGRPARGGWQAWTV
ncbi:hypothetical protein PSP6_270213 [Paraburkholderia tropica]|nr:hypothetical protein PSP6_270213 [Paraburkholderia tropica]